MSKGPEWSYELEVDGTKPRDLPLEALGELAKRLSDVLGSPDELRFAGLKKGCARLQVQVAPQATDEVRLRLIQTKAAHSTATTKLNDFLASKGWSADLKTFAGATVLHFPGKPANEAQFTEPRVVKQLDHIIGVVTKIGGRDESVPMTLRTPDGMYVDVTVKGKAKARALAHHLFGEDLRVSGLATWACDETGSWVCQDMIVSDFEELSSQPLDELFADLRAIEGNGWKAIDDPFGELERFRGDD